MMKPHSTHAIVGLTAETQPKGTDDPGWWPTLTVGGWHLTAETQPKGTDDLDGHLEADPVGELTAETQPKGTDDEAALEGLGQVKRTHRRDPAERH